MGSSHPRSSESPAAHTYAGRFLARYGISRLHLSQGYSWSYPLLSGGAALGGCATSRVEQPIVVGEDEECDQSGCFGRVVGGSEPTPPAAAPGEPSVRGGGNGADRADRGGRLQDGQQRGATASGEDEQVLQSGDGADEQHPGGGGDPARGSSPWVGFACTPDAACQRGDRPDQHGGHDEQGSSCDDQMQRHRLIPGDALKNEGVVNVGRGSQDGFSIVILDEGQLLCANLIAEHAPTHGFPDLLDLIGIRGEPGSGQAVPVVRGHPQVGGG